MDTFNERRKRDKKRKKGRRMYSIERGKKDRCLEQERKQNV